MNLCPLWEKWVRRPAACAKTGKNKAFPVSARWKWQSVENCHEAWIGYVYWRTTKYICLLLHKHSECNQGLLPLPSLSFWLLAVLSLLPLTAVKWLFSLLLAGTVLALTSLFRRLGGKATHRAQSKSEPIVAFVRFLMICIIQAYSFQAFKNRSTWKWVASLKKL